MSTYMGGWMASDRPAARRHDHLRKLPGQVGPAIDLAQKHQRSSTRASGREQTGMCCLHTVFNLEILRPWFTTFAPRQWSLFMQRQWIETLKFILPGCRQYATAKTREWNHLLWTKSHSYHFRKVVLWTMKLKHRDSGRTTEDYITIFKPSERARCFLLTTKPNPCSPGLHSQFRKSD